MSGLIRRLTNKIFKNFTRAGWERLPQELVDEILGYLLDDLDALKACSLTCKHLFGPTRPLIHQHLYLVSGPEYPKSRRSLFGRGKSKVDPRAFGRLIDADRLGLLRYTRHLTFKERSGILGPFHPSEVQKHLPHLRSITRLRRLTLDQVYVPPFFPVFEECFGMFVNTVRQLDVRGFYGTVPDLFYFICQFPLLEDLNIIAPSHDGAQPGNTVPAITQLPPFRGKLVLSNIWSGWYPGALAVLPGGLNFHALELYRCNPSQVFLGACSHTVTSVSYSWHTRNIQNFENCESNVSPRINCDVTFRSRSISAELRAKRGARKIRIHLPVVQSFAT